MKAGKQKADTQRISLKGIQKMFFHTQLVLIISLALILGIAGTLINIHFETKSVTKTSGMWQKPLLILRS
jgi:hypothetical protein